jgi:hypothetical protein
LITLVRSVTMITTRWGSSLPSEIACPVSTNSVPGARGNHWLLILVGLENSLRWKRMSRLHDGVAVTLAARAGDEILA